MRPSQYHFTKLILKLPVPMITQFSFKTASVNNLQKKGLDSLLKSYNPDKCNMTLATLQSWCEFPDEISCKAHFKIQREHEGVICKKCKCSKHYWLKTKF